MGSDTKLEAESEENGEHGDEKGCVDIVRGPKADIVQAGALYSLQAQGPRLHGPGQLLASPQGTDDHGHQNRQLGPDPGEKAVS